MIGGHFLKGWSRTQNNVTLSSAEAELIAMVKCSSELMGMRSAMRDWGVESSGVVYADSSAALAIANRKGAGKLRHINVSSLWIQEKKDLHDLEIRKVLGTENPADLMTKYLTRAVMDTHLDFLSQRREAGRAKSGLNIQGASTREAHEEHPSPTLADQTQTPSELTSAATGEVISTCVSDDWLRGPQPHQLWSGPWTGKTLFQATDGTWRTVSHKNARRAFITPNQVAKLKLPLGVKWTGSRCTVIHPVTKAPAFGAKPSATSHQAPAPSQGQLGHARKLSEDRATIFNDECKSSSVGRPLDPVSPHTGGGGGVRLL